MKTKSNIVLLVLLLLVGVLMAFLLRKPDPVAASRFIEPDKLFGVLEANVRGDSGFEVVVDIDHAHLGAKAGSSMPPSHVLNWSDPALEAAILKHNPVAAVDLPLRVINRRIRETFSAALAQ